MKTKKNNRGGARKGAGRKPLPESLRKKASSITLSPDEWKKLDNLRGNQTRSAWISEKLRRAKH